MIKLHPTLVAVIGISLAMPLMAADRPIVLPYRSGVEIEYQVQRGDTPTEIRGRILRQDIDWQHIEALNSFKPGTALRPGQILRIPVTWLNFGPKYARVQAISGTVRVNGGAANTDSKLTEKDAIETGKDGIVVLILPDGTEMSIAPSSVVRIERLRQYFDGDTVDARLRLERGQIESTSPELNVQGPRDSKRKIQIQTPKATAAVRGTQFRVSDSDKVSASSVLNGKVNWTAAKGGADLLKGFGASANASGQVTPPEVLLKAPMVRAPDRPIANTAVNIPFEVITGAVAYRVKIAANTNFSSHVSEQVVTEPLVRLISERDGNHFIAVRAISGNGVGGHDGIGKVTILARPTAPTLTAPAHDSIELAELANLRWTPNPQADAYRVQIAADKEFSDLLVDSEVSVPEFVYRRETKKQVPVRRFWRVAAVDGWTTGPFTAANQFLLNVAGPKPTTRDEGNGRIVIEWEALPGARYTVLLDPAAGESGNRTTIRTNTPVARFDGLNAGKYEVRIVAGFDDDLLTGESEATAFTVQRAWTDHFGETIETLDGPLRLGN